MTVVDNVERHPVAKCDCGMELEAINSDEGLYIGDFCPRCNRFDPHNVQIGQENAKPVT